MSSRIFFSYSRDNSKFVLNLAKELRSAGADIWLDQLDIDPGARWDKSIEKALKTSPVLLVILSNSSVMSHNVMDEVSYALEENKKIVPVLMEACEIPFRLRRFQYANFTEDHQKGINSLIKALNLETEVAEKLSDISVEVDNHEQKKKEEEEKLKREAQVKAEAKLKEEKLKEKQQREEQQKAQILKAQQNKVTKSSGCSTTVIIIGAIITIIFCFLVFLFVLGSMDEGDYDTVTPYQEVNSTVYDADWNLAVKTNTLQMYLTYVSTYGQGNEHYLKAANAIEKLLVKSGYIPYTNANNTQRYFNRIDETAIDDFPRPNDFIIALTNSKVWTSMPSYDTNASLNGDIIYSGEIVFVVDVIYEGLAAWVQVRYPN
ncbi:toll/interleukin-1 receptor domain-containing protein [Algibacter amylolyticus]|uniref:Toll/interleukin-1 receptor domain-containing protein n=1 Tax=Algibacter amylolyticus TaxID=1608400 RepID=A0A5M7BAU4_9FLAO|nr:toll/interleukin-1 receptor domain-containing protein [Algibacter amylolyticus]KAA5824385.1 toll/interleukin-1 receptor domain-containing protein [Algibacter amylolyticus]MBB5269558.1 hypothetical protein [Algibacter amylolyticus]TSJ75158.1 toll/interleukin-1 receptor domain-containing protein [Algibacter amylolyticus]